MSVEDDLRLLVDLAEYNVRVLSEHASDGGPMIAAALEETTISLKQLRDHLLECSQGVRFGC